MLKMLGIIDLTSILHFLLFLLYSTLSLFGPLSYGTLGLLMVFADCFGHTIDPVQNGEYFDLFVVR